MSIILAVCTAYVIGSIPSGYLIAQFSKGIDIRDFGSGNIGTTNVFRTLGLGPGIATLAFDMMKGFLPIMAVRAFLPDAHILHLLTGFAAISGHNWSIFLNFKGGKGVATAAGVFFGILTLPTFVSLIVFIVVFIASRYVSLASISASATLPLATLIFGKPLILVLFAFIICGLIIYKHWPNIQRLREGKENRFDFSKSFFAKDKPST
ncbi:MAG: glycerol-3-phosphate 1-O-acyltransferase PlsY [bacterium]